MMLGTAKARAEAIQASFKAQAEINKNLEDTCRNLLQLANTQSKRIDALEAEVDELKARIRNDH